MQLAMGQVSLSPLLPLRAAFLVALHLENEYVCTAGQNKQKTDRRIRGSRPKKLVRRRQRSSCGISHLVDAQMSFCRYVRTNLIPRAAQSEHLDNTSGSIDYIHGTGKGNIEDQDWATYSSYRDIHLLLAAADRGAFCLLLRVLCI